jgi:uncharacterized protein (DUF58 family)
MPVTNPSAIVDAAMADLLALAGFNPAPVTTRKYAPPVAILPEKTPVLAVWTEDTDYEPVATTTAGLAYERRHNLVIGWWVNNPSEAELGGTGDPVVVQALDAVREQIVARCAAWGAGVPTIGPQVVATVRSSSVAPTEGVTWVAKVNLVCEEAS